MSSKETDIDLLLIGKTGNGKSALGNSILDRNLFHSNASTNSVTRKIQRHVSNISGRQIKVVYGPGVGDTRTDNENAQKDFLREMNMAISNNPQGYHAFLIVFKFGVRYTSEEIETVNILKQTFGEDFLRNFGILVMTHGDIFEKQSRKTGQNFEQWCASQTGELTQLLAEFNNRVLLFDNETEDPSIKQEQRKNLIRHVDSLTSSGHRYSNSMFDEGRKTRDRILIESKRPRIKDETMTETSLIMQKLGTLQKSEDEKNKVSELQELLSRTTVLHQNIEVEDNGTGVLHEFCLHVQSLQKSIENEIEFTKRIEDEKVRQKQRQDEQKKVFEEALQSQEEKFKTMLRKNREEEERKRELEKQEREKEQKEREKEQQNLTDYLEELEQKYEQLKAENDDWLIRKIYRHLTRTS